MAWPPFEQGGLEQANPYVSVPERDFGRQCVALPKMPPACRSNPKFADGLRVVEQVPRPAVKVRQLIRAGNLRRASELNQDDHENVLVESAVIQVVC
jgi:hypothetical protein